MKRILSLSVALAMVFSMAFAAVPSATAQAAGTADGIVRRRALAIGNAAYAESALTAPEYDARHMAELFKQMNFSGTSDGAAEQGAFASVTQRTNRTRKQILSDIAAAFAGADADDVSYFYYSGHGSVISGEAQIVGVDMAFLSLTDLKKALDAVPGTKVLLLDSCFSGGFISRSTAAPQEKAARASAAPGGKLRVSPALQSKLKKAKGDPGALFPFALARRPSGVSNSLDVLFNRSVKGEFGRAPAYMTGGGYIVLTAAAVNEYSYEMPFNSIYGPSFIMGGIDYAGRDKANSGEFTGMLVAGAGFVTFNSIYGETGLLADYNGDRRITAAEMAYFLKGAVLFSDVSAYPEPAGAADASSPVIFSQAAAASVPAARVRLASGTADVTTPAGGTSVVISLDLSGIPAAVKKNLAIYKFPKITDGTGANGMVDQTPVKKFEDVGSGAVTWDGKDASGNDAPDGVYKLALECGEGAVLESDPPYLYPGVTLVLNRGCSEYTESNKVTFSGGADGAPYTAEGAADIASDGARQGAWFTAPVTGAMNVTIDATALNASLNAVCMLMDADGNVVNYVISAAKDRKPYLPFYVEKDHTYRLRFGIDDDPDSSGDVGRYSYRFRLNPAVAMDSQVSCNGGGFESWVITPGASPDGDYVIASQGSADPAATLVDGSQTSALGTSDDYDDKNFRIQTPLLEGHAYLLVTRSDKPFRFTAYTPGSAPKFATAGIPVLDAGPMGHDETVADPAGKTTYRLVKTGANEERWSFIASAGMDGELSQTNDPSLLLMDGNYTLVGASDDYNNEYDSVFSAVLEPHRTYVLACHSAGTGGYNYNLYAMRTELTAADYVVDKPKAVFTDNCGLSLDRYGTVSAWGLNRNGELGLGAASPSSTPSVVMLPEFSKAVDVWAGETAAFARMEEESYCYWGLDQVVPTPLTSLDGLDIADIRNGYSTEALVRTYTGELYMLDVDSDEIEPVVLPGEDWHSAVAIDATEASYIALAADGKLFAWGLNWKGECGTGGSDEVDSPKQVTFPDGAAVKDVAAGWDHVLALTASGEVYAWGTNAEDELGQGASSAKLLSTRPVKVSGGDIAGKTIAAVWAGADHSMCMDADGNVYGWGSNAYGEFGFGDVDRSASPRRIDFYGPGKVAVQSMGAGESAVFAQDFGHAVYGYGSNEDYQLARAGQAPDGGIMKLMTLRGAVQTGHPSGLRALHLSTGSAAVAGGAITVTIGAEASSCYIVPEPADSEASVRINGQAARGILVSVPAPGSTSGSVSLRISHPGGTPADETYTLVVRRVLSTNASLKSLKLSPGAAMSPSFAKTGTSYRITLPETVSTVTVTPAVDGYKAYFKIDTLAANTPRTYRLATGQTLYSTVAVTAQSGNRQAYDLTVTRPKMLTALSGSPMLGGRASLSPGGTNRITIRYSLSFPATVKLEIYKGGRWTTLFTRKETSAGAKSWEWDGKVGGRALAYGTYKLRMTPVYGGKTCAARTMYAHIYAKPTVSVPSLSPGSFKPDGKGSVAFSVSWSRITNVRVEIVNGDGKAVCTVYSAANLAPATRRFSWNGFIGRSAAPAGAYRVKVTCGSVVAYRSFRIQ